MFLEDFSTAQDLFLASSKPVAALEVGAVCIARVLMLEYSILMKKESDEHIKFTQFL
jgi:hypothetical protein